ncbi:MAG: hypothetical protein R3E12_08270 [Candidatus Eisenbacteria bacterium]
MVGVPYPDVDEKSSLRQMEEGDQLEQPPQVGEKQIDRCQEC